jgi:hypothetical protein
MLVTQRIYACKVIMRSVEGAGCCWLFCDPLLDKNHKREEDDYLSPGKSPRLIKTGCLFMDINFVRICQFISRELFVKVGSRKAKRVSRNHFYRTDA